MSNPQTRFTLAALSLGLLLACACQTKKEPGTAATKPDPVASSPALAPPVANGPATPPESATEIQLVDAYLARVVAFDQERTTLTRSHQAQQALGMQAMTITSSGGGQTDPPNPYIKSQKAPRASYAVDEDAILREETTFVEQYSQLLDKFRALTPPKTCTPLATDYTYALQEEAKNLRFEHEKNIKMAQELKRSGDKKTPEMQAFLDIMNTEKSQPSLFPEAEKELQALRVQYPTLTTPAFHIQ